MMEVSVEDINELIRGSSLYCLLYGHVLVVFPCTGNHGSPGNNCMRYCNRVIVCQYSPCTWSDIVSVSEEAHSWSVGWCGQTCTVCKKIELFHLPGGCWYCS